MAGGEVRDGLVSWMGDRVRAVQTSRAESSGDTHFPFVLRRAHARPPTHADLRQGIVRQALTGTPAPSDPGGGEAHG